MSTKLNVVLSFLTHDTTLFSLFLNMCSDSVLPLRDREGGWGIVKVWETQDLVAA